MREKLGMNPQTLDPIAIVRGRIQILERLNRLLAANTKGGMLAFFGLVKWDDVSDFVSDELRENFRIMEEFSKAVAPGKDS